MVRNLSHLFSTFAGTALAGAALLLGVPWFFALIPIPIPYILWHIFILTYESDGAFRLRAKWWAKRRKIDLTLWSGITQVYRSLPNAKNPVPLVAYRCIEGARPFDSYIQIPNADGMFNTADYAVFGNDHLGMHRVFRAIGLSRQADSGFNFNDISTFEMVCRVMRNRNIDAEHILRYHDALGSMKATLKAIEMDVPIEYAIQAGVS